MSDTSGKRWVDSKYGTFPVDDDPGLTDGAIDMLRGVYEETYEAAHRDPLALEHLEQFAKASLDVLAIIATGISTLTILVQEYSESDTREALIAAKERIKQIVESANDQNV